MTNIKIAMIATANVATKSWHPVCPLERPKPSYTTRGNGGPELHPLVADLLIPATAAIKPAKMTSKNMLATAKKDTPAVQQVMSMQTRV